MWPTLFQIPTEVAGVPVFGLGWLLAVWTVFSVLLLAWLVWRQGFNAETRGWIPLLLIVALVIAFVLPALVGPQGLPIRGFGSMMVVAIIAGLALAIWRAPRMGIHPDTIVSLSYVMLIAGIIGARVFYIVEYRDQFQGTSPGGTLFELVNVAQGGMVFYGAAIGGVIAFFSFAHWRRVPALALADVIAPSLALGLAIGRVGCFMTGCCYGGPSDLPWSVTFPPGSPLHFRQIERGTLYLHGLKFERPREGPAVVAEVEPGSPAELAGMKAGDRVWHINNYDVSTAGQAEHVLLRVPAIDTGLSVSVMGQPHPRNWGVAAVQRSAAVHPTQLYSTLSGLLLCAVTLAYTPLRRRDGEVLALLVTLYPLHRFVIEIIRQDEPAVFQTGLTISQNISLVLLVVAVALWVYLLRRPTGTQVPAAASA